MSEFEKAVTGLGEECGVFGAYDVDGHDVAASVYYGLFALQHRGQESCGIAVSETNGPKGKVTSYKGMGLVNEVFTEENLEPMHGDIGVGHVRYSTTGRPEPRNAQPLTVRMRGGFCKDCRKPSLLWKDTGGFEWNREGWSLIGI